MTNITLALNPIIDTAAKAEALSALQLEVKMRGAHAPRRALEINIQDRTRMSCSCEILWVWEVYNYDTKNWVMLGNNNNTDPAYTPSLAWTWVTLKFPALSGPALPYLKKDGSTYTVLVRQTCMTLKADAINIDYMAVNFVYACDGEETPTPTPTPVTPTPTEAPPAPPTPTPKPEPCTKDVAALPKSLETAKADYILPGLSSVSVMRTASNKCTGVYDCWGEYVEFKSGTTEATRSKTNITLALNPIIDTAAKAEALSALQLEVKMRGAHAPRRALEINIQDRTRMSCSCEILWVWEVYNYDTKNWVMLGNNNNTDPAYTPSLAWTWVTLKFPALSGPALPYLKKDGSTYTVLVRQTCMTLKADAINIDYMAVNFVYAPPCSAYPTPKPEPCTKDVAALPKSLETAKADYILPGLSSVSVMRTASNKCTGVYDCWAKAEALSALQLEVKMRAAYAASSRKEILWVWEVYNYDTKNWVMLGNNNNTDPAYTPSLAWTWVTLKFPALSGPALPYLKKDGSTYTVLVRQTCMTLKADAINIDYMAVNFVYACDGEETPTPTPTPVTPTPTEAPPAPPTPTPKPEPCTKDVAALPKSLETAKFPALSGPALPYLKKDGSTYTVLVRQTCMTLKADAINIDYMAVNFVYACDGEETPTPTPTPVTPTPTEAPPAPPTPTPKPEPCTKDVAALPKSLETAKADYILPGLSSVSVMRTASNKCTGVYDCWAKAEALSALQLEVKMRGAHAPRRALEINIQDRTRMSCSCEILWVWEVYNYDTKNWVMLGNNNNTDPAYTPSLAWTWVTLKFPALSGPALPYLKKDGSTYTVLVRQTCMTLKADAINIDYMAVNFVYACDGEETPTPTPTPVTPTPTEAPPAPPTPTPKPEPCTKDVAALPKSLETAKADYILPGLSSVSVMRTASNKCTGVYDCWGEYVEFKSGTTEATRSKTNITLALNPIIDTAAKAEALSALQLEVKMRGAHAPRRALEINIQDRTRMSCSCVRGVRDSQ
eukprot:tig00020563_g11345.t1